MCSTQSIGIELQHIATLWWRWCCSQHEKFNNGYHIFSDWISQLPLTYTHTHTHLVSLFFQWVWNFIMFYTNSQSQMVLNTSRALIATQQPAKKSNNDKRAAVNNLDFMTDHIRLYDFFFFVGPCNSKRVSAEKKKTWAI